MNTPDFPRASDRLRWAAILIERARHDLLTAANLIDGAGCDCHGEDAAVGQLRGHLGPLAQTARDVHAASSQHRAEDEEVFGE